MINIRLVDILEVGSQYTKNIPLALAISSLFIYEIFSILPFTFKDVYLISTILNTFTNFNGLFLNSDILSSSHVFNTINPVIAARRTAIINLTLIEALGHNLYTHSAIWLIITSIVLLLAMVAPIFIARYSKINH